jgi:hypothetical protein
MAGKRPIDVFKEILREVRSNPETEKMAEEHQVLYGILSENDLRMRFTI